MVKKEVKGIGEIGKKVIELGLGIVGVTEKKVREVAAELIKRGEIKRDTAEKFVDKVLKKTEKDRKDLEERLSRAVKKVIDKLSLVTKRELDELRKRIEELEKKL